MKKLLLLLFPLAVSACGSVLDTPEAIPISRFPAEEPFTLTLVMESCADVCATYDDPSCNVGVNRGKAEIRVDASVGFDRMDAPGCTEMCGGEILAHCDIPALPAGTYTVVSGPFRSQIFLQ